jgi:hypothetical protein
MLDRCQQMRKDHTAWKFSDVFEGTCVVWWKGACEADECVLDVLIIWHVLL